MTRLGAVARAVEHSACMEVMLQSIQPYQAGQKRAAAASFVSCLVKLHLALKQFGAPLC